LRIDYSDYYGEVILRSSQWSLFYLLGRIRSAETLGPKKGEAVLVAPNGGWVRRANDGVLAGILTPLAFFWQDCPIAKYRDPRAVHSILESSVRKVFPPVFCMTVVASAADRQNSIEKQDTLFLSAPSCHAQRLQCQHLPWPHEIHSAMMAALSHLCE
jgi:hypothetical protein